MEWEGLGSVLGPALASTLPILHSSFLRAPKSAATDDQNNEAIFMKYLLQ